MFLVQKPRYKAGGGCPPDTNKHHFLHHHPLPCSSGVAYTEYSQHLSVLFSLEFLYYSVLSMYRNTCYFKFEMQKKKIKVIEEVTNEFVSNKHLQKQGWSMGNRRLCLKSGCACWDGCAALTVLVYCIVSAGTSCGPIAGCSPGRYGWKSHTTAVWEDDSGDLNWCMNPEANRRRGRLE